MWRLKGFLNNSVITLLNIIYLKGTVKDICNKIIRKRYYYLSLAGYILVETLVSVAILSIGLVMILRAFSHEINALRASKNYTRAYLLAEEKMCEIERSGKVDIDKWNDESGNFGKNFPRKNFHWQVEINPLRNELGEVLDIVSVNVVVTWQELGTDKKMSLFTYSKKKID